MDASPSIQLLNAGDGDGGRDPDVTGEGDGTRDEEISGLSDALELDSVAGCQRCDEAAGGESCLKGRIEEGALTPGDWCTVVRDSEPDDLADATTTNCRHLILNQVTSGGLRGEGRRCAAADGPAVV